MYLYIFLVSYMVDVNLLLVLLVIWKRPCIMFFSITRKFTWMRASVSFVREASSSR